MTVRRNAPKYADFSDVVDACVIPARRVCFEPAGDRRALGVGEVSPEHVVRVARGSARRSVLRAHSGSVRSARSNICRGGVPPSSMSSHSVTHAMPRVRPSPISRR